MKLLSLLGARCGQSPMVDGDKRNLLARLLINSMDSSLRCSARYIETLGDEANSQVLTKQNFDIVREDKPYIWTNARIWIGTYHIELG
jgi:hypothetical protein